MPYAWETKYADEIKAIGLTYELDKKETCLTFYNGYVGDEGAKLIVKILLYLPSLKNLSFCEVQLDENSMKILVSYIQLHSSINTLSVAFKAQEVGTWEALKKNNSLISLNLWSSRIGNMPATELAKMLKVNTCLISLDLECNMVSYIGAAPIAEVLEQNTSLLSLNLSENYIENEGAIAFAEMLKTNKSLTKLSLRENAIKGKGATAIAEVLKQNTSLLSLDLLKNYIEDEGVKSFAKALKTNFSLTFLRLSKDELNLSGEKDIETTILEQTGANKVFKETIDQYNENEKRGIDKVQEAKFMQALQIKGNYKNISDQMTTLYVFARGMNGQLSYETLLHIGGDYINIVPNPEAEKSSLIKDMEAILVKKVVNKTEVLKPQGSHVGKHVARLEAQEKTTSYAQGRTYN